jgi:hypothetical protein
MVKPVLVVVDDEYGSLRSLAGELESRYGAHYRIVASASAQEALAWLAELRAGGARVPVILADQWLPGMTAPSCWRGPGTSTPRPGGAC